MTKFSIALSICVFFIFVILCKIDVFKNDKPKAEIMFTCNLSSISIPIKNVKMESDLITIVAQGIFQKKTIKVIFVVKKDMQPFNIYHTDQNNVLVNVESNPVAKWNDTGSVFLLEGEPGLNFANLLLSTIEDNEIYHCKKSITFDTALLYGDIEKIKITKFNKNGQVLVRAETQELPDLEIGKAIPNLLKFKLEYVVSKEPLVKCQFLLSLDLDKGFLTICEKDIEMRSSIRFMLASE